VSPDGGQGFFVIRLADQFYLKPMARPLQAAQRNQQLRNDFRLAIESDQNGIDRPSLARTTTGRPIRSTRSRAARRRMAEQAKKKAMPATCKATNAEMGLNQARSGMATDIAL
jgi:hypothetical protein